MVRNATARSWLRYEARLRLDWDDKKNLELVGQAPPY